MADRINGHDDGKWIYKEGTIRARQSTTQIDGRTHIKWQLGMVYWRDSTLWRNIQKYNWERRFHFKSNSNHNGINFRKTCWRLFCVFPYHHRQSLLVSLSEWRITCHTISTLLQEAAHEMPEMKIFLFLHKINISYSVHNHPSKCLIMLLKQRKITIPQYHVLCFMKASFMAMGK